MGKQTTLFAKVDKEEISATRRTTPQTPQHCPSRNSPSLSRITILVRLRFGVECYGPNHRTSSLWQRCSHVGDLVALLCSIVLVSAASAIEAGLLRIHLLRLRLRRLAVVRLLRLLRLVVLAVVEVAGVCGLQWCRLHVFERRYRP